MKKNIIQQIQKKILEAKLKEDPKYIIQKLQQDLDLQLEKNKI